MRDTFNIASILPFWRYAVCPSSNNNPGIPFYKLSNAVKFAEETNKQIPWFDCYLVKRKWFPASVELIKIFKATKPL